MNIREQRTRLAKEALELGRRVLEEQVLGPEQAEHFVFLTISGAHIYGFPSPDSDLDLRGAHCAPLR